MTSRKFLITGTDTGVGKSTVGCALGFAFRARGLRVGVMKPAETGCEERGGILEPSDARALMLACGSTLPIDLVCPYRYRSRLAPPAAAERDNLPPPDIERITRCFREISDASDVALVEGVGGIAVPIKWGYDYADLAAAMDLTVIVVVGNRLGCLNVAVLTLGYAQKRGLRIAGWLLNDTEPAVTPAAITNAASLTKMTAAPCLGTMRYKEPLAKSVIDRLLA